MWVSGFIWPITPDCVVRSKAQSGIDRNGCPLSAGTGVRFRRITHPTAGQCCGPRPQVGGDGRARRPSAPGGVTLVSNQAGMLSPAARLSHVGRHRRQAPLCIDHGRLQGNARMLHLRSTCWAARTCGFREGSSVEAVTGSRHGLAMKDRPRQSRNSPPLPWRVGSSHEAFRPTARFSCDLGSHRLPACEWRISQRALMPSPPPVSLM